VYASEGDRKQTFDKDFNQFLKHAEENRPTFENEKAEDDEEAEVVELCLNFVSLYMNRFEQEYKIRGYTNVTMADNIAKRDLPGLKKQWMKNLENVSALVGERFPLWSRRMTIEFLTDSARSGILANLCLHSIEFLLTRLLKAWTQFTTSKSQRKAQTAVEVVNNLSQLVQKAAKIDPTPSLQKFEKVFVETAVSLSFEKLSGNVRARGSQIRDMKQRYRREFEAVVSNAVGLVRAKDLLVQRLWCVEAQNMVDKMIELLTQKKDNFVKLVIEMIKQIDEFLEKGREAMETLDTPQIGFEGTSKFGDLKILAARDDGIFKVKLPFGVGYFAKDQFTMKYSVQLSSLRMSIIIANMSMEDFGITEKADEEMTDVSGDNKEKKITIEKPAASPKTFFASEGHSLAAKDKKEQNEALSSGLEAKEAEFDKKKQKVVCQLTNNRKRIMLNEDHTILDLYQHIKFLMKAEGTFELLNMGITPPTTLDNPEQSVKEAGLNRSRIKMQLV